MPTPFDQSGYDLRFGWGRRAVRDAVRREDVLVIVDVLSFSTCVAAAVAHGATIHPFAHKDRAAAEAHAREVGAELKTQAPSGRRALSPLNFGKADAGRAYVLPSPNGSACSRAARTARAVFAGALVNAGAVAGAARAAAAERSAPITVVACGELWRDVESDENVLRPALEDALGAGAILDRLGGSLSPEADVCVRAYGAAEPDLAALVFECASGRELCEASYQDDVRFSSTVDALGVAPRLSGGAYRGT